MDRLTEIVQTTAFVDVHEHLLEESSRLRPPVRGSFLHPCEGWAYLFSHYALDDLVSAGMSSRDREAFLDPDVGSVEKWEAAAPHMVRASSTGAVRAARVSIEHLTGLPFDREHIEEIELRLEHLRRPGFYRVVLRDHARVAWCQINSLEHTFCQSPEPDLLRHDINISGMTLLERASLAEWTTATGVEVASLADYLRVIARYLELFGGRAVALKTWMARSRPLAVEPVRRGRATRLFERWCRGLELPPAEFRALQDFVIEEMIGLASEYRLPVKIHTGYHVGTGYMDLGAVRDNVADLCALFARHPDTTFVVMHAAYPYMHEAVAVAKHYPNVFVDLSWAWVLDPPAAVDLVRHFVMAAPWSKLFGFGGDYVPVENVVGHAELARRGIRQALQGLVTDGWLTLDDVGRIAFGLMRENAERVFRAI